MAYRIKCDMCGNTRFWKGSGFIKVFKRTDIIKGPEIFALDVCSECLEKLFKLRDTADSE